MPSETYVLVVVFHWLRQNASQLLVEGIRQLLPPPLLLPLLPSSFDERRSV